MVEDFQIFFYRFLLSLTPDTPLEENLRALMAPMLGNLRHHTGADVALHLFANPLLGEAHAMVVGVDPETGSALRAEAAYRHRPVRTERTHRSRLPIYQPLQPIDAAVLDLLFEPSDPVPRRLTGERVLTLLGPIADKWPAEFGTARPQLDDTVIAVPLGTGEYARLGTFLLWGRAGGRLATGTDDAALKGLMAIRKGVEQVMIRVFTNLYGMVSSTYLPSFHQAGAKPVALFCAEIRGFDHVCQVLGHHNDSGSAARHLSSLVRSFSRTAADIIERNQGRVDQLWGSGILGAFGEHVSPMPGEGAKIACMRALTAASEFVNSFAPAARRWLEQEFDIESFRGLHPEEIRVEAIVLVDYGPVVFEYVGSSRHQSYMAVGDRVDFVKALIGAVDRHAASVGVEATARPIVLSQAAFHWSREMLREVSPEVAGQLARASMVTLPGKTTPFPVHFIQPANIQGSAR